MHISGLSAIGTKPIFQQAGQALQGQKPGNAAGENSGFSKLITGYVDSVNQDQQASAATLQDLLTGKTEDIIPVVAAVAKADMSFKLLMGIRNKVIEAYKQTINMPV